MRIIISSGDGPRECEMAVGLFAKYFVGQLKDHFPQLSFDTMDSSPRSEISIDFDDTCKGFCSSFVGTIQWICKSPLRPNHLRKNWFIKVFEVEDFKTDSKQFDSKDFRFENFKGSGNGGQNIQKNMTAVRVIHLPSGTTAVCSNERSLLQNKKLALANLQEKLREKGKEEGLLLKNQLFLSHHDLERGNPVAVFEGPKFIKR